MADCGTSPYQMIEYRGLFDLNDAQVLRAEIVSIDRLLNTAEVTLLDTCESASWIDLEAVPFFYHCENSTGTVEDLARGHKAFTEGDMVYILANKESGDNLAQAYIIGHVDIKGTRVCTTDVLLVTQVFRSASTWYTVYAIINPQSGELFDIDSFENFDESSPAKPSVALGVYTTDVSDWVAYNFVSVSNSISVPRSVGTASSNVGGTLKSSIVAIDPWLVIDDQTDYTGVFEHTVSSGNACDSINTGNELQDWHTSKTGGSSPVVTGSSYASDDSWVRSGISTYNPGGDPLTCRAYWQASVLEHDILHTHKTTFGWNVFDNKLSVTAAVRIKVETHWNELSETYYDAGNGTLSGGLTAEFFNRYTLDFTDLYGGNIIKEYPLSAEANLEVAVSEGGSVSTSPAAVTGDFVDIPYDVTAGTYHPALWAAKSGPNNFMGSGILIGDDGIYTVFGCVLRRAYKTLTVSGTTFEMIGFVSGQGWNNGTNYPMTLGGTSKAKNHVMIAASSTPYSSTIDPSADISITECTLARNMTASVALVATLEMLYAYIHDNYTLTDVTNNAQAYLSFQSGVGNRGISLGPTFRLIKKKV